MKKNNKGFTLVELLAVIVIMGILMMAAIPAITRAIENSRKDTFVDIAKSYVNSVRTLWTSDNIICGATSTYSSGLDDGNYYILIDTKNNPTVLLDQGGKSSWGNRDVKGYVRVNVKTENEKKVTKFYVALSDGTHGIYDNFENLKESDKLSRADMIMNLEDPKHLFLMETITVNPFINGVVTTCSSEGGNWDGVKPKNFAEDDWGTITKAIKSRDYPYQLGETKVVDMGDEFGTHTVRVANRTIPSECYQDNFSQTACGFIVEFTDGIIAHKMNSVSTNAGGWPASELRTYLNNDIFNGLPSALQAAIRSVTVISGHGSKRGEENFTSTDKMYLLSTKEIWNGGTEKDSAEEETRQLDYYKNKNVTVSSYRAVRKSGITWWTRTPHSGNGSIIITVNSGGNWGMFYAKDYPVMISPAFRIA